MIKRTIALSLFLSLFSAATGGVLALPDSTVAFWMPFKNPDEAVDFVKQFLSPRKFVEIGRKQLNGDGVFQADFQSRVLPETRVTVSGVASGEESHCTKVDFWLFTDEYDLSAHAKGSRRDKESMATALEVASDLAAWLRQYGAENVNVSQAEKNEKLHGSIVCMRTN